MLPSRKTDKLAVQLKQKLQPLSINKLALESGFVKRKPIKIKPLELLLGFFIICLTGGNSLSAIATALGLLSGCCISKQAIDKRINEAFIKFLESVLAKTLLNNIDPKLTDKDFKFISCAFKRHFLKFVSN